MQVVVKKSVLFKTLKKILNENRTGHSFYSDGSFLGRFEEEETDKNFINSDTPLRPNPEANLQLHTNNFDVTDPEFVPSSKSSFLSAASAVLEHVPEGQIEKVYEKLHSLLDEAHEEEDKRNYGSLQEVLQSIILESSGSRADELFQKAASLYSQGGDYLSIVDQIDSLDIGMTRDDIEDKVADMAMEIMMSAQASKPQPKKPAPVRRRNPSSSGEKTIIRRRAKKEEIPPVPSETEVEDLYGDTRAAYENAENKELFMQGYNDGADAGMSDLDANPSNNDLSYITGYEYGHKEFSNSDDDLSFNFDDAGDSNLDRQELEGRIAQRNMFSDNIPEVLKLIPEFYMLTQDIGYKIETDRYNLMMAGDPIKDANKNIRVVYNIGHMETFITHNLTKPFFNKDYALRSARKHLKVILDRTYNSPAAQNFRSGFIQAIGKDGIGEEEAKNLLTRVFVDKILEDVANINYEPDQNKKIESILMQTFAQTTVYKTGKMTGAKGGSEKDTAKPYQGNTSATFYRRVKEEYREDIILDFLDKLSSKYLVGTIYKIPSGRKDPNNPKRNEYYEIDADEFGQKAEDYANQMIDKALSDQEAAAAGKIITPEDEVIEDDILGDEDSPDSMSDEEIAEKLSNTKDFETLAPFFGFSGAPGMRQWFLKFAKRFYEMGLISQKSGDRTLLKFHSEMVEATLELLSEKLPSLADELGSKAESDADLELSSVALRAAAQVQDAFQEFLDVGDNLVDISVEGKQEDGTVTMMPFLDTLGGQLARSFNGIFFKKVLTKLDKSWTDYVANELQTNEQFKNYIADNISSAANIDAKAAKSVAEYFIGKKNAPEIISNKAGTERVYKSEAEGNPTKGVKTLLKYGIDANAYHIINTESRDWFEDMLMTDFAKIVDFEGQYRQMILKDFDKARKNDKDFKKLVLTALNDVIVGSSERMAMQALSDYEVQ